MRRAEFAIDDPAEIATVLQAAGWGTLSLHGSDGWPYAIPVNFVLVDGKVHLHSAAAGRKIELLGADDRVALTVVEEFSLVPSYATGGEIACSASQFFKSVAIRGRARALSDLEQKARILSALMAKYQPEGRHAAIDPGDPRYAGMIAATRVLAIDPVETTAKFKFGQHLSEENAALIEQTLARRGSPGDAATIEAMRRYRALAKAKRDHAHQGD